MDEGTPPASHSHGVDGRQPRVTIVADRLGAFDEDFRPKKELQDINTNDTKPPVEFHADGVGIGLAFPPQRPTSGSAVPQPLAVIGLRTQGPHDHVANNQGGGRPTQITDDHLVGKETQQTLTHPHRSGRHAGSSATPHFRATVLPDSIGSDGIEPGGHVTTTGSKRKRKQTNSKPRRTMGHMPDLFYIHKPEKYTPYGFDCSEGKTIQDWVKNMTQKHWSAGHFHQEFGTEKKAKQKYRDVLSVRLEPLAPFMDTYKALRKALWGTPLEVEFSHCPNRGQHILCKVGTRRKEHEPIKEPKKSLKADIKRAKIQSKASVASDPSAGDLDIPDVPEMRHPQNKDRYTISQEREDGISRPGPITAVNRLAYLATEDQMEESDSPTLDDELRTSLSPAVEETPGDFAYARNDFGPRHLRVLDSPTSSDASSRISSLLQTNDWSSRTDANDFESFLNRYKY